MSDQHSAPCNELAWEDEVCDEYRSLSYYPDWDEAIEQVRYVMKALRALPVEQRMEAMGMAKAKSWGKPVIITHYHDAGDLERGVFPHHRTAYVEACDRRVGADHADHQR